MRERTVETRERRCDWRRRLGGRPLPLSSDHTRLAKLQSSIGEQVSLKTCPARVTQQGRHLLSRTPLLACRMLGPLVSSDWFARLR
jgi:hypothetical protein